MKKKRPGPRARGYDAEWQALRARYIKAHPLCQHPGCAARAAVVDHIIPVRVAPALRLAWSNLQSLCARHHSGVKQRSDNANYRKPPRIQFDSRGYRTGRAPR